MVNFETERQTLISQKTDLKYLTAFDMYCQNFAMVLLTFYKQNYHWVETYAVKVPPLQDILKTSLTLMTNLTTIKDQDILKTCADFWLFYTSYYQTELKKDEKMSK